VIEVIVILFMLIGWLGYRGYLALVDYLLEKVVVLIQVTMITTSILGVFK
jgi:hypothetical protein